MMEAVIAGGAALGTGAATYFGGKGANEMNLQISREANAANRHAQDRANAANRHMAYDQREFSAQQAQLANQFTEKMSNSAYQRSMKDMQAAGLNPMLAFGQGGASTPSAAMGTGQASQDQASKDQAAHVENAIGPAVSSALDFRRLKKEIDQVGSNIDLNKQMEGTQAAIEAKNQADAKIATSQLDAIKQKAKLDESTAKENQKWVREDALLQRTSQGSNILSNALNAFRPLQGLFNQNQPKVPRGGYIIDRKGEIIHERP